MSSDKLRLRADGAPCCPRSRSGRRRQWVRGADVMAVSRCQPRLAAPHPDGGLARSRQAQGRAPPLSPRPGRPHEAGACPLKAQCTRNKGGRRITRWVDEPLLEPMEQRVHARPDIMQPRQERVVHPCGTMKWGWDQGDFLRRGLAKVRAECSLTVLAYNLRRVLNLVDMPRLLASLD